MMTSEAFVACAQLQVKMECGEMHVAAKINSLQVIKRTENAVELMEMAQAVWGLVQNWL
jgi:hypothetical protein